MAETSMPWEGTSTGDATIAPYSAAEFSKIFASLTSGNVNRGVVFHELNELAVTGATSPAAIGSGRAMVDGTFYENDADATLVLPTPSGAARIDRVVLQKHVLNQEVRVGRVAGAEGGGAPALTQTPGVVWEFPLAQVTVATNGALTIVDQRVFPEDIHSHV